MSALTPEQVQAVNAPERHVLLHAGPGTGKTRTLVARVVHLLDAGVHPSAIVVLTFTRKAAGEFRERLRASFAHNPLAAARVFVGTFHSWCAVILRQYPDFVGLASEFNIRDEQDRDDLVRFVGAELGLKWTSTERLWKEAAVRDRYKALMREVSAVDFDQLEDLAIRVLEHPRCSIRNRLEHVLVDEAHDCNEAQVRLLKATGAATFAAFDPWQSIYGFRGAVPAIMAEAFPATTYRLTWNYRSRPLIVGTCNEIINGQGAQVAARVGPPGRVGYATGDTAEVYWDSVALRVSRTHRILGDAWSRTAILAPTWALLDEAARELGERDVPVHVARKDTDAWSSPEARWLVNAYRVLLNPHDHVALWAVLNAWEPRVSREEWATARSRALTSGESVLERAYMFRHPSAVTLADACRLGTNLTKALAQELDRLHLAERAASMRELLPPAEVWLQASGSPARAFLDWHASRLLDDAPEGVEREDAVQAATIHAFKGLEAPHVFVLGATEGRLPRSEDPEVVAEARRLLYVAMTRAEDTLTICIPPGEQRTRFLEPA